MYMGSELIVLHFQWSLRLARFNLGIWVRDFIKEKVHQGVVVLRVP